MTDGDDGESAGGGPSDAAAGPADEESSAAASRSEPVDWLDERAGAGDVRQDDAEVDRAPLSDLARHVSERKQRRAAESASASEGGAAQIGSGDDIFEEMSVGEIDEETLWSSLEDAESEPQVGIGEPAEPVEGAESAGREHVVDKEQYCQKCPHLGAPPELRCTHEGTDIVEVLDSDRFRVRNCPMVSE